jgi:4'-phosphopantetheinyl transferase
VISGDSIDIWQIPLSFSTEAMTRLEEFLNPEERARSGQFHFPQDRQRYTISRGALRFLLAEYLDDLPENIVFGLGKHGKPFLAQPLANGPLSFNLSHCNDLTLVAATSYRHLGVDVEKVRTISESQQIMKSYFTREECGFIQSAKQDDLVSFFLRIWARREATAKALGLDLSEALSSITIPTYALNSSCLLERKDQWFITDLRLDSTHIGVLCAEGNPCEIMYRDFQQSFSF